MIEFFGGSGNRSRRQSFRQAGFPLRAREKILLPLHRSGARPLRNGRRAEHA